MVSWRLDIHGTTPYMIRCIGWVPTLVEIVMILGVCTGDVQVSDEEVVFAIGQSMSISIKDEGEIQSRCECS